MRARALGPRWLCGVLALFLSAAIALWVGLTPHERCPASGISSAGDPLVGSIPPLDPEREAEMPSVEAILAGVTAIANEWRPLAIAWHVLLGAFVVGLLIGWRPSNRLAGSLLAMPFVSVSVLAWTSGNPFNGAVFAALALALTSRAIRLSRDSVHIAPRLAFVPGVLLVAFGWGYPHFLATQRWITYVYAAPLGLLPCPTLSAVIGLTLVLSFLRSKPWTMTLSLVALAYGVIGVFRLGVTLDYVLLAGATMLAAAVACSFRLPPSLKAARQPKTIEINNERRPGYRNAA
jgi:hypothetical protein